jgi:Uma2 family endonuclease
VRGKVMATIETKLITAEEFYDWANRPENQDKYCELERGEIVQMSRPGKRHGLICANAIRILWNYAAQRKKGYVCSNDTGIIVERDPDTVRGPDIMFFEDATKLEEVDEKYGETPPLLSVEVLSPNDTLGKVMRRVREQLDFGTQMVWVVDPEARNITAHHAARSRLSSRNGRN